MTINDFINWLESTQVIYDPIDGEALTELWAEFLAYWAEEHGS